MKLLALAAAMLACAGPPRHLARTSVATPWCFPLVVDANGAEVHGRACADRRHACYEARDVAMRIGRAAGIVAVGECGYE